MYANFKIQKQTENELLTPDCKPSVMVTGRMKLTKDFSLRHFSNIIDGFGMLKDFKKVDKTTLHFFISITSKKILPLLKALETDNYFEVEELKDIRTMNNNNLAQIILLINIQVS